MEFTKAWASQTENQSLRSYYEHTIMKQQLLRFPCTRNSVKKLQINHFSARQHKLGRHKIPEILITCWKSITEAIG